MIQKVSFKNSIKIACVYRFWDMLFFSTEETERMSRYETFSFYMPLTKANGNLIVKILCSKGQSWNCCYKHISNNTSFLSGKKCLSLYTSLKCYNAVRHFCFLYCEIWSQLTLTLCSCSCQRPICKKMNLLYWCQYGTCSDVSNESKSHLQVCGLRSRLFIIQKSSIWVHMHMFLLTGYCS